MEGVEEMTHLAGCFMKASNDFLLASERTGNRS